MVTLGVLVLLLLIVTRWFAQRRLVEVAHSGNGAGKLLIRFCPSGTAIGKCEGRLSAASSLGRTVAAAVSPLIERLAPAQFGDGTQRNYESARTRRGLDLCRCARNYKERFLPCLFLPML
jgi:hypothetical protein